MFFSTTNSKLIEIYFVRLDLILFLVISHVHLLTMIKIYGLRNCDTCRRAIKDLEARQIAHEFHDFRRDGLDLFKLKKWTALLGYGALLNKRGTTWRGLGQSEKEDLNNKKAIALIYRNPALIKRPVFEIENTIVIGYKDDQKRNLGL